jgi:hypothetical protein
VRTARPATFHRPDGTASFGRFLLGEFAVFIPARVCYGEAMKAHISPKAPYWFCTVAVLLGLLLTGCATRKVDWNSRVGSYTYDQAVAELGPPDKQAKLSDGKTVAEWYTGRSGGSGLSIGVGSASYGRHSAVGVGVSQSVSTGGSPRGLRLVFDTDGKLTSWSK